MSVTVRFLPDGPEHVLPNEAVIGRSAAAQLRLDSVLTATTHAEITPRGEGLVLRALRGEVRVNGRSTAQARVVPGQRWWFAPGVELEVVSVDGDAAEVARTQTPFVWCPGPDVVVLIAGDQREVLGGTPGAILRHLLQAPTQGHPWEPIARAVLEIYRNGSVAEASRRQRFRNLFDQHKVSLNEALIRFKTKVERKRQGPMVWMDGGGLVYLRWDPLRDRVDSGIG